MSEARRLAAILAADVAGYSRLMGEDEAGTAQGGARAARGGGAYRARLRRWGWVKTTGDGVLLGFLLFVVAAVECAIPDAEVDGGAQRGCCRKPKRILYRIVLISATC